MRGNKMNFYIWNQTLGILCIDCKYRKGIVLGSSSFCAMSFGCANIARLFIAENKRIHIDTILTDEACQTIMRQQLEESFDKAIDNAKKPL
jgi:hypothetical protein